TNNHVISGASSIEVTLSTGRTYTADVVGTDPAATLRMAVHRNGTGDATASHQGPPDAGAVA
ncbi:hypothetical protein ACWCQ6_34915, partial [Streptomyces sp. NPDC001880]